MPKKVGADQEQLCNYRPVSNLPFASKVLEKVVLRQLLDYMEDNRLTEHVEVMQSAYKFRHSVETGL